MITRKKKTGGVGWMPKRLLSHRGEKGNHAGKIEITERITHMDKGTGVTTKNPTQKRVNSAMFVAQEKEGA